MTIEFFDILFKSRPVKMHDKVYCFLLQLELVILSQLVCRLFNYDID